MKIPEKGKIISKSEISDTVLLNSTDYLDIHDDYEFVQIIGHGKYGTVREARKLSNNARYAVKSINKNSLKSNILALKREVNILTKVYHPNIIRLFEAYEDEKYFHSDFF